MSLLNPTRSPQGLRIWALAGVAMAITQLTDPLRDPTLVQTTIFWLGRLFAVLLSFAAAEWLVQRYAGRRFASPAWLAPVVITTLIACVGLTGVEMALEGAIPQRAEYDDAELSGYGPLLVLLVEYATIASVMLPINLVLWLLIDQRRAPRPAPPTPPPLREPPFLAKTRGIRADQVLALGAEEHYVRVYADGHSELIHQRLSEAAAQMPPARGLRVHRSWWVAADAVSDARRKTRRWELVLHNGLRIPVSDSYTAATRARGLLVKGRGTGH